MKQSSPRQKKNCLQNFDLSEHRQILSDLAIHIYHQFITVMEKNLTPAVGTAFYYRPAPTSSAAETLCFTWVCDSTGDAGAREPPGHFQHEAVGLQEAIQQHLRGLGYLHHLLHHSAAHLLPFHHEPARHGADAGQPGCEAALLPGGGHHPQQHHAAQRYVFLQERDADQVSVQV